MIYVVVEELIPEMSQGKHTNIGTIAFTAGFTLMMMLDVALGVRAGWLRNRQELTAEPARADCRTGRNWLRNRLTNKEDGI